MCWVNMSLTKAKAQASGPLGNILGQCPSRVLRVTQGPPEPATCALASGGCSEPCVLWPSVAPLCSLSLAVLQGSSRFQRFGAVSGGVACLSWSGIQHRGELLAETKAAPLSCGLRSSCVLVLSCRSWAPGRQVGEPSKPPCQRHMRLSTGVCLAVPAGCRGVRRKRAVCECVCTHVCLLPRCNSAAALHPAAWGARSRGQRCLGLGYAAGARHQSFARLSVWHGFFSRVLYYFYGLRIAEI